MKLFLVYRPTVLASVSPYRLLDEGGQEIAWANAFLDAQRIRQLSLRSLRAYAFDLLHFARWWSQRPLPLPLSEVQEATLLDYVRYQLDQEPHTEAGRAAADLQHEAFAGSDLVGHEESDVGVATPLAEHGHLLPQRYQRVVG